MSEPGEQTSRQKGTPHEHATGTDRACSLDVTHTKDNERPVLLRDVIRHDGSHSYGFRVFCPSRRASIDVDVCRECAQRTEICADASGFGAIVRCVPNRLVGDQSGAEPSEGVAVGSILSGMVLCVHPDMPLEMLTKLFAERGLAYVVVVDDDATVWGIVRERNLLDPARHHGAESAAGASVAEPVESQANQAQCVTSSALVVREGASLRGALHRMARAHAREAIVVNAEGVIVGVVTDIEALNWIAELARDR